MPKITTVFAGSPQFAADILQALHNSKFAPCAIFTQPDRPQGRGRKVKPNAVKQLASSLDLPIYQPKTLRDKDAFASLAALQPDVLIVAAYGLILPPEILALPTYGCVNVHASILPRWRGAAPIERAIMAGDSETGVCIMQMEAGLDTGPVYCCSRTAITEQTQANHLEKELAAEGANLLIDVLTQINLAHKGKGKLPQPKPQDEQGVTYANKLTAADRVLDWTQPAQQICQKVMALGSRLPVRASINGVGVQLVTAKCIEQTVTNDESLAPGTIIDVSKSGILVQCETDLLQITTLKVERGKGKLLDAAAAVNGFSDLFFPGARLI